MSERNQIDSCVNESLYEGLSAAAKSGLIATVLVALGNTFHKGFRTNVGISGKVATIIMPAFGSFILSAEHSISACRKRVHEYQRAMKSAKSR